MLKKHNGKKILIIEDDADIQNFISRVLELEGYQVDKASDGKTGMEIVRKNHIDLILLDLRLPGPDGWSILRAIKRDPEFSGIPVVVITAIAEATQRKKTLRMGAASYLVKPLSAHSLIETITGIFYQEGQSK
jgi:two-component system alkaline phosphatase synthesis response regulator PhoP